MLATSPSAPASPPRRRLLGDLLVRERLITPEQLAEALDEQAAAESRRPLGEILVDRGALTREALNVVLDKYHKKYRLGDLLVETNTITEAELDGALAYQKQTGLRLGDVLLALNLVTERQMREALCKQLRVPFVDLDALALDPALAGLIPAELAAARRILPIARAEGRLTVAVDDPTDADLVEALEAATGGRVEVVTSTRDALARALARLYPAAPAASAGEAPASGAPAAPAPDDARETQEAPRPDAEVAGGLDALRAGQETLRRERNAALQALRALERRHAEAMRQLAALRAANATLRESHAAAVRAAREYRREYEALLRRTGRREDDFEAVLRQLRPRAAPERRQPG